MVSGGDPDRAEVVDDLFEALSAERRRRVLSALLESGGELDFAELVEHVAERESESTGEPRASRRETVATALHHVHLPALRDADLVRVVDGADRTVQFVTETRTARALEALCEEG